jgi:hypothetical protein
MYGKHFRGVATTLLLVLMAANANAQTGVTAGEFTVEPPTLVSLGFDWKIDGDDNRNAQVEVSYRKKGDGAWKKGLPLLRLQREWMNGGPPQANDNPLLPRYPFDWIVPTCSRAACSTSNPAPSTNAASCSPIPTASRASQQRW